MICMSCRSGSTKHVVGKIGVELGYISLAIFPASSAHLREVCSVKAAMALKNRERVNGLLSNVLGAQRTLPGYPLVAVRVPCGPRVGQAMLAGPALEAFDPWLCCRGVVAGHRLLAGQE